MTISPKVEEAITRVMETARYESVDELLLHALDAFQQRRDTALAEFEDSLIAAMNDGEEVELDAGEWRRFRSYLLEKYKD